MLLQPSCFHSCHSHRVYCHKSFTSMFEKYGAGISCVPSRGRKLHRHSSCHQAQRRRAPPSSLPTRPFRTNPARLIPTSREIFSTRHTGHVTPPFSLSTLAHRCRTRLQPRPPCHRQVGPAPHSPTRFTPNTRQKGPPPCGPRPSHRNHTHGSPLPHLSYAHAARSGGGKPPTTRTPSSPPPRPPRLLAGDEPPPRSSAWSGFLLCGRRCRIFLTGSSLPCAAENRVFQRVSPLRHWPLGI